MTTRLCTKCGKEKDISESSWSIRGIKTHSRCKGCHAEEPMEYYERNKDRELEYKWERQQRKREEARGFVEEYKASHPCIECGKTDPRFLTFDHVRGTKKKAISDMVNLGYTIGSIQAELEKCEV